MRKRWLIGSGFLLLAAGVFGAAIYFKNRSCFSDSLYQPGATLAELYHRDQVVANQKKVFFWSNNGRRYLGFWAKIVESGINQDGVGFYLTVEPLAPCLFARRLKVYLPMLNAKRCHLRVESFVFRANPEGSDSLTVNQKRDCRADSLAPYRGQYAYLVLADYFSPETREKIKARGDCDQQCREWLEKMGQIREQLMAVLERRHQRVSRIGFLDYLRVEVIASQNDR